MVAEGVSVIIPVYNTRPVWLQRAVESVLRQEGAPEFEVIVVDDNSTDFETWCAIEQLRAVPGVRCVHHPQRRLPGACFNTGLFMARYPFVALLGSDDEMLPDRLLAQLECIQQQKLDVLGGDLINIGPDGAEIEPTLYSGPGFVGPARFASPTVMLRRSSVFEAGGFDMIPRPGSDWRLWDRMLCAGFTMAVRPGVVTRRRIHPGSFTFQRSKWCRHLYHLWETGG